MIRSEPLAMHDLPLADRHDAQFDRVFINVWNELTEASEALERRMDDARDAHRADCLARYGCDIFAGENGHG